MKKNPEGLISPQLRSTVTPDPSKVPRINVTKPMGEKNRSTTASPLPELVELEKEDSEAKMTLSKVVEERNFYYSKLRRIEIFTHNYPDKDCNLI